MKKIDDINKNEVDINYIQIRGAEENNLKNIDIDIPKNKLVVITGVSGSGKSSLAFDTIYAEGQRKYVESLSTYARQFLGIMDKPKAKSITGLSPAIAIDQKTTSNNPRSTVGTVTEIYDYIRLLYSNIGVPRCPICGRIIQKLSVDEIVSEILKIEDRTKIQILSPAIIGEKGMHEKLIEKLTKDGFIRVKIDGEDFDLSFDEISLDKNKKHDIDIVVDRLIMKEGIKQRLSESVETAMKYSNNLVKVLYDGKEVTYSGNYSCYIHKEISYDEISPRIFSFNNPYGACDNCTGIGYLLKMDEDLLMPDKNKTLYDGLKAFGASTMKKGSTMAKMYFEAIGKHYGVDIKKKIKDLPRDFLDKIMYGTGDEEITFEYNAIGKKVINKKTFEGVIPILERRHRDTKSDSQRRFYELYMTEQPCNVCKGARLKEKILHIFVGGINIYELTSMPIKKIKEFLEKLELSEEEYDISKEVIKEITTRLSFLIDVGLSYLTLSREASTLSGGEAQRIRLATQIGSGLSGVIYILDEPSIGLHQRDNKKLINTLKKLKSLGNSVIVVEHDEETMMEADYIIDIGKGAGRLGGKIIAKGTPEEILKNEDSLTGGYLSGKLKIDIPKKRRKGNGKKISLKGVSHNNLKNINIDFPLGKLIVVTGVSGSGKSSLISDVLYKAVNSRINKSLEKPGKYEKITGVNNVDKIINIDQSPIGRTPRSNPATYIGAFDQIRDIFAETNEAKLRGYTKSRFSFNVPGGRCESCSGDGVKKISMYFMPDRFVTCEVCGGKKYNSETLEVKYKGKTIADVLDMTADEALEFFENKKAYKGALYNKIKLLVDVGLGYIKLGQNSKTLSGGEAQRIKLAKELSKISTTKTLYILDEPTTGLHMHDVKKLINILNDLTDQGNTLIVIEHNLDVIKNADYIIDMGPEGGDAGGEVVATGTPEEVSKSKKSNTAPFIKKYLKNK